MISAHRNAKNFGAQRPPTATNKKVDAALPLALRHTHQTDGTTPPLERFFLPPGYLHSHK